MKPAMIYWFRGMNPRPAQRTYINTHLSIFAAGAQSHDEDPSKCWRAPAA